MSRALYRRYRPKSLDEVAGQDHVATTLKNAIKSGKISHAYLLTGPKGVGKTSVARILAHEINKLPYTDDREHIDIIEIDAASNRRIDEIRDLRDKARLSPLQAPYKVYIIDEVHMLTREAFNALLKTLEEPPEHVVFILATTEAHKLPETIISRTQRYTFKPIENTNAATHLKQIAKKEKITIDDAALELIAQHGHGSFRDSISLLDQISNTDKHITVEDVRQHLGIPPEELITDLATQLRAHDAPRLIALLEQARQHGYQATTIASQLSAALRQDMLSGRPNLASLKVLRDLLQVPGAAQPYQELELVLLEHTLSGTSAPTAPVESIEPSKPAKPVSPEPKSQPDPGPTPAPKEKPQVRGEDIQLEKALDAGLWNTVMDELRGAHNTLYGIARMATVKADGDILVLGFAFDFHRRRFSESRNQDKLQAILAKAAGSPVEVRCEIDKAGPKETPKTEAKPPKPASAPEKSDTLDSINAVFGGGAVLED